MLITARSYAEYAAMFDLDELPARILDCCAGGSSFAAEANRAGAETVAVDPVYSLPEDELADALRQAVRDTHRINADHAGEFVWTWYGSPAERDEMRAEAAEAFLADKRRRPERYVAAALPDLPFESGRFDLALCSHLLFTWAGQFGPTWHVEALRELLRVCAGEVRVFPLVLQGTGRPVEFLPEVLGQLDARSEVREVNYELQRGANQMLVLSKRG